MKALLLLLLFLFAHSSGWACGLCLDQTIMIKLPFAGFLPLLGVAWVVTMALIRARSSAAAGEASPLCPSRKLLARATLLGAVGYLVLWVITATSFIGSGLIIGLIWLVSVIMKTADFGLREFRRLRGDRLAQTCFAVNVVFLALAAALIPLSHARARSTGGLVARLHYDVPEKGLIVLPALIAKGETAAAPLVGALNNALAIGEGAEKKDTVASAAYCLGKIGGAQAAACLGEVVRTQVDFKKQSGASADKDFYDQRWRRAVCFAYGEAASAQAVPDLIALYERSSDESAREQRWAILSALARTRSRAGLAFVFDHMDVLLEKARGGGADSGESEVARATAAVLVAPPNPESLKTIPSGPAIGLRGLGRLAGASGEPEQAWRASGDEIRKRWMEVL